MAQLKRELGFWTVFSLTITAMIGTGLFFGVSIAAQIAGNASVISWIILGILTIYVGACFGELTSMYPSAGGIYEFSKHAYGKGLISFLIGWTSWIVINVTSSLLIVAALEYFLPSDTSILIKLLFSSVIIIFLNTLAYFGTNKIANLLGFFAAVIIILLLAFIIFGFNKVNVNNYSDFFSKPPIMILVAIFFIVETFFGWENATFMAEETKNPEKTIPKALLLSSVFVSFLGILLAFVMLGVIPWQNLSNISTPITFFTETLFNSQVAELIKIGVVLALIGSAAGGLVGSPRLLLGLARDKLFIEQLSEIHPKYQTPYRAIVFQTIVSIIVIFIGFGKYEYILSLLVPIGLLMYISVILSVTILRFKNPTHPRPFKVWFGKIGPIIVSMIYLSIVILWTLNNNDGMSFIKLGFSLILFGIPIFLLLVLYYDPEGIKVVSNFFANIELIMENFNFPKKFRKELLSYFEDIENKVILEYGSGVGTLTIHLAEKVGPKGKIYATDMSKKNIEILIKRLMKRNLTNVEVIHDEHQINRIHPSIKNVDMIFSVGMLSYIQDVKKVLKEMYKILPKHGKICMVEYVDYFWILPNVKWLSDNKEIEKVFRSAGFSVHVIRKRRFLWNYLIIYGIKSDEDIPYI
ncbi:MAG: amino acid permease [Candidatus Woesearchaeota archaeon]